MILPHPMEKRTWSIKELLFVAAGYLQEKGVSNPRLDAEVLLAHVLGVERITLYLEFDRPLTAGEVSSFRRLVKRRADHEPLQYITGKQEFWSLEFTVNPHVLIPRPESELLVEHALRVCGELNKGEEGGLRILDLCTGCGAIAVSIAKELPQAQVWATDCSGEALTVARINTERHGVASRVKLVRGELFEPLRSQGSKFHVIVSNPPYVATEDLETLPRQVRDYEPRQALDGGPGGMVFIERIIKEAPDFLAPSGRVMIEMDARQTARARELVGSVSAYRAWDVIKDYGGLDRVFIAGGR